MIQRLSLLLLLPIPFALDAQEYCLPAASFSGNGTDHTVQRVLLQQLHYANTNSLGNTWWDFAYRGDSSTTRLYRGMTYTLTVMSGTATGTHHAAWLDFHNEPTGLQADELLPLGTNSTPQEMLSYTFEIPEDATVGLRTLRVRAGAELDPADPCAFGGVGESEDYLVLIEGDRCIPLMYNGTSGGDSISSITLDAVPLDLATGRSTYKNMGLLAAPLSAGSSYDLAITTGAYNNNRVGAWADWNGDGLFEDTESIGNGANTTPFETITLPFEVPSTVPAGSIIALRVRLYYAAFDVGACTDLYHGQTVDYALRIDNTTGITAAPSTEDPRIVQGTQGAELITPSSWSDAVITVMDATGRVLARDRVTGERMLLDGTGSTGMLVVRLDGRSGSWTGRALLPR